MKLVREEPETAALQTFLDGAALVSSELVLTEVPRAIGRAAAMGLNLPADTLLDQAEAVLQTVALRPLDRALLVAAGALGEPGIRALDALHVVSAIDLLPHDGLVSYDERQSAAARLGGLRTFSPGR